MKAKFVKPYAKAVEENGKKLPHAMYEIVGEENIQEYLDNTAPQYQRFADEAQTRPLFFSRLYINSGKDIIRDINVFWDNDLDRYVSPELTEQREAFELDKAINNLMEA